MNWSLLISALALAVSLFFNWSTMNRTNKKDTEEEAQHGAAIMAKLENIQTSMIEMKTEIKGYRDEVRRISEQEVRNEEKLKSLHKRVDACEKMCGIYGRGREPDE